MKRQQTVQLVFGGNVRVPYYFSFLDLHPQSKCISRSWKKNKRSGRSGGTKDTKLCRSFSETH
mgnify:FL=1